MHSIRRNVYAAPWSDVDRAAAQSTSRDFRSVIPEVSPNNFVPTWDNEERVAQSSLFRGWAGWAADPGARAFPLRSLRAHGDKSVFTTGAACATLFFATWQRSCEYPWGWRHIIGGLGRYTRQYSWPEASSTGLLCQTVCGVPQVNFALSFRVTPAFIL